VEAPRVFAHMMGGCSDRADPTGSKIWPIQHDDIVSANAVGPRGHDTHSRRVFAARRRTEHVACIIPVA